jgi:hypothetical protein
MKAVFCLILLGLMTTWSFGQTDLQWWEGTVVSSESEVVTGEISYDLLNDLLLFRSSGETIVLPAHKIQLFRFYDRPKNINRQFISLEEQHRVFRFYEIVVQGKMKVMRQAKLFAPLFANHEIDDYNYFIYCDGQIIPIQKFRTRVYPELLKQHSTEMNSFVEHEHLNINDMRSAILIIKAFNKIDHQQMVVARAD